MIVASATRNSIIAGNAVTQATMSHPVCLYTGRMISRCLNNVDTYFLAFVFLVEDKVSTTRQTRNWRKKI